MSALLAMCATHRVVEGDVRSFSRLPAAATAQQPMTYRLERLPSQQTPSFDPILALAEQALARAGLQRNADSGQWVVPLGAQAGFTTRRDPFYDHPPWAWGGGGWEGGRGGWGMSGLWQVGAPAPLHRRVVSIVMRDARTQEVAQGFLAAATAAAHAAQLPGLPDGTVILFPPVPLAIQRVANVERAQMLMESSSRATLQRFLAAWQPILQATRSQPEHKGLIRWLVDVDPLAI